MSFGLEVFDLKGNKVVEATSNTLVSVPRGVVTLQANGYSTVRSNPIPGTGELFLRVIQTTMYGKIGFKGGNVSVNLVGRAVELVNGTQQGVTIKLAVVERV